MVKEGRRGEGKGGQERGNSLPPPPQNIYIYIFGLTQLGMDKAKHNASVAAQATEGGIKTINHVD